MSNVPIPHPLCSLYVPLTSPSHSAVTPSESWWWLVLLSVSTHCELRHLGLWAWQQPAACGVGWRELVQPWQLSKAIQTVKHSLFLSMIHHLFCGSWESLQSFPKYIIPPLIHLYIIRCNSKIPFFIFKSGLNNLLVSLQWHFSQ